MELDGVARCHFAERSLKLYSVVDTAAVDVVGGRRLGIGGSAHGQEHDEERSEERGGERCKLYFECWPKSEHEVLHLGPMLGWSAELGAPLPAIDMLRLALKGATSCSGWNSLDLRLTLGLLERRDDFFKGGWGSLKKPS